MADMHPPSLDFIPPSVDYDIRYCTVTSTSPSRQTPSRISNTATQQPYHSPQLVGTSSSSSPNKIHKSKKEGFRIKSVCRYGPGCTHIADYNHREKFWHPSVQELTGKIILCHL